MVSEGRALTVMMSIMTMAAVIRVKIPKGRRIQAEEPNTEVVIIQAKPQLGRKVKSKG